MKKVKVRLKCVFEDKQPGEEAIMCQKHAEENAKIGWVDILEVLDEEAQEEKPAKKKK